MPNGAQTHGIFKNLLKNISKDSILIDLANSNFYETDKKLRECEKKKIKFLATGISGGIQARKNGFSLMVSGNIEAWENRKISPQRGNTPVHFHGGEIAASIHLEKYFASHHASSYKKTRNGLDGLTHSTKLSPWRANGVLSVRRVISRLPR